MTDYDIIREALDSLSGDPTQYRENALAALDRMEKEEKALREKLFGWQAVYAESGRLRRALREIADSPTHVVRDLTRIARRALGEEVPLPRSFLDDPKIQAQIAEAKERARKGGDEA